MPDLLSYTGAETHNDKRLPLSSKILRTLPFVWFLKLSNQVWSFLKTQYGIKCAHAEADNLSGPITVEIWQKEKHWNELNGSTYENICI